MPARRHVLAVLATMLFGPGCASRAVVVPPMPASVSLGDGGAVVSLPRNAVYLMDPEDGIVAVELATDQTKWSAGTLAAKPFAEVGDALIGADDSGAIRVLDARTGKPYAGCSTIPGFGVQLQDLLGAPRSSSGMSDGTRAWISWSYGMFDVRGMPPRPGEASPRGHSEEGVFEIDVATCSGKRSKNPYEPPRGERQTSYGERERTTPSGTTFRVTLRRPRLERQRGKTKLPPIDLTQGNTNRMMVTATSDLRHVIVSEFDGNLYPSAIFDIETGTVVAKATLPFFPTGSVLIGRLLVIGNYAVAVVDLDKNAVLWIRPLRSTRYTGPYPS